MKTLRRYLITLFISCTVPMMFLFTMVDNWFIYHTNEFNEEPRMILIGFAIYLVAKLIIFCLFLFIFVRRISKRIREENVTYNQEKNTLFANIAHDLKTPSTAIMGFAKALRDGAVEPEKQPEILKTIYDKSKQSNELLDLMFQYTKLDSSDYPFHYEIVDLVRLTKEAVALHYDAFEERELELTFDFPEQEVLWSVDPSEFSRALNNLIINALRHNEPHSRVLVSLTHEKDLRILVADDGIEIPAEQQEKLFLPFTQEDSSRHQEGSGLGLAITQKIIARHQGSLTIIPVPGYTKGFLITLPHPEQKTKK